ncbi:MAG TPA: archaeosortase/exosortase family protein [Povalibacter sp.]|nr:archaeosortase/exosortase family protein [Povalibacter sp.]
MLRHSRTVLLAAILIAVWPVWRWMAARVADGSADNWELLAAVTAFVVLIRDRHLRPVRISLWVPVSFLLAYSMSFAVAAPLVRGLLAMGAVGSACSALWYGRRIELPLCGLWLISLPWMSSLNFYLGYPLRVAVGTVAQVLLQANGIAATRDGTLLLWNGESIAIDAPCSGIRMLWTGAYLCLLLAAWMRLTACRTVALAVATLVIVVAANILRATSLFYVEAGLVAAPGFVHAAVGLVMFLLAGSAVLMLSRRLARVNHAYQAA